jgi:hypothetical protein
MLIRREVFAEAGLLDEQYFLYFEETDFCLQARRAGWSCWHQPQSRVVHLVGQSTGVTNPFFKAKRRPRYWFASRLHYFQKNHGRFYTFLSNLAHITGVGLWRLRRALQRKPDNDPPGFLCDFLRYSFGWNW